VVSLSQYLILQLQLFTGDGRGAQRVRNRKLQEFQAIGQKLSVYEEGRQKTVKFKCVAAILHNGQTVNAGHYTCWVRSSDGAGWLIMEDTKTPRHQGRFRSNLADIYLLFLERV